MTDCFKLVAVLVLLAPIAFTQPSGKTRTYYIAADEVDWDYARGGVNRMMGMKFEGYSTVFTDRGPHRIGTVYRKAIYREYTDETFAHFKARSPEWEHAGIIGPILRAELGDTIRILFKKKASRPYSMHPHGVFYAKDSVGALTTMALRVKTRKMTPLLLRVEEDVDNRGNQKKEHQSTRLEYSNVQPPM